MHHAFNTYSTCALPLDLNHLLTSNITSNWLVDQSLSVHVLSFLSSVEPNSILNQSNAQNQSLSSNLFVITGLYLKSIIKTFFSLILLSLTFVHMFLIWRQWYVLFSVFRCFASISIWVTTGISFAFYVKIHVFGYMFWSHHNRRKCVQSVYTFHYIESCKTYEVKYKIMTTSSTYDNMTNNKQNMVRV